MKANIRDGFTLAELLVVSVIIGILLALLLRVIASASRSALASSVNAVWNGYGSYAGESHVGGYTPCLFANGSVRKFPMMVDTSANPMAFLEHIVVRIDQR